MAEWSKAVDLGSIPKGRGFKPHLLHFLYNYNNKSFKSIKMINVYTKNHFSIIESSLRTSGPRRLKMAVRKAIN